MEFEKKIGGEGVVTYTYPFICVLCAFHGRQNDSRFTSAYSVAPWWTSSAHRDPRPLAELSPYTRPVNPHHRWRAGPHVSSTHAGKAIY